MTTPAANHKRRIWAIQAASPEEDRSNANAYELMLEELASQKRELKRIKSTARKVEAKSAILPEWSAFLDQTLKEDKGVQNPIIGQLLIWSIDVGDFNQAMAIASYMFKHNLKLPEHFSRDTGDAFVEEMSEAWLASPNPVITFDQLSNVESMVEGFDLLDEVRSKLYRALGEAAYKDNSPEMALSYLRKAVAMNDRIGCKQLIGKIEKELSPDQQSA